jgi:hypothetical protein
MDESIYEPDDTFPFDKLVLTPPTVLSGGNYFLKFHIDTIPLYIQAPKCLLKQGFNKGGKKIYCDLMFSNENEAFIEWMEKLETHCHNYIYRNRKQWFENDLEMHDIENSFTSPLKIFKSGKFYIARTTVPTRLGKCTLKIFDEGENVVNADEIKDNTKVITILEIQGIKCSAKSFQIEIEVKQMMVLRPSNLFEKCIIATTRRGDDSSASKANDVRDEQPEHVGSTLENAYQDGVDGTNSHIADYSVAGAAEVETIAVVDSAPAGVREPTQEAETKHAPQPDILAGTVEPSVDGETLGSRMARKVFARHRPV